MTEGPWGPRRPDLEAAVIASCVVVVVVVVVFAGVVLPYLEGVWS